MVLFVVARKGEKGMFFGYKLQNLEEAEAMFRKNRMKEEQVKTDCSLENLRRLTEFGILSAEEAEDIAYQNNLGGGPTTYKFDFS